MKKVLATTMMLIFTAVFPLLAVASSGEHKMAMDHSKMDMDHGDHEHGKMDMDHGKDHEGHDHGDMHDMDHGQMQMAGGMVMLGNDDEEGVKAMAHVKVYDESSKASMAKMGMTSTHHFMVVFADDKSGQAITEGMAAVKVKAKDGEAGKAVKLMPMKMTMGTGFGADVTLPGPGEYEFKLGTKLADGKKRQFKFEFKAE